MAPASAGRSGWVVATYIMTAAVFLVVVLARSERRPRDGGGSGCAVRRGAAGWRCSSRPGPTRRPGCGPCTAVSIRPARPCGSRSSPCRPGWRWPPWRSLAYLTIQAPLAGPQPPWRWLGLVVGGGRRREPGGPGLGVVGTAGRIARSAWSWPGRWAWPRPRAVRWRPLAGCGGSGRSGVATATDVTGTTVAPASATTARRRDRDQDPGGDVSRRPRSRHHGAGPGPHRAQLRWGGLRAGTLLIVCGSGDTPHGDRCLLAVVGQPGASGTGTVHLLVNGQAASGLATLTLADVVIGSVGPQFTRLTVTWTGTSPTGTPAVTYQLQPGGVDRVGPGVPGGAGGPGGGPAGHPPRPALPR